MPKEKLFDPDVALEKAIEVFWKKGYNGTSINDLVDATGLSRSSLYATYIDKHQLFMQALQQYERNGLQWLEGELGKAVSPKRKIETFFYANIDKVMKDTRGKGCLMINTATEMTNQDKQIAGTLCNNLKGIETLFLNFIKQGQASGELSKTLNAAAVAQFLLSSYLGLRVTAQTDLNRERLENIVKATLSVLG